jgi:putative ABC transport system permease protein
MEAFWQDLRHGLRFLLKNRGFTVVVIVTLALGIGANTAIFSVVNAALLRQLPYADPNRLVALWDLFPRYVGMEKLTVALPNVQDWKSSNHVFSEMGAFTAKTAVVKAAGEPEQLPVAFVSEGFFPTLGVQPWMGRTFTSEESRTADAPVALVTFNYWQRFMEGQIDAVGKSILVDRTSYTVVGIMPPDFKLAANFMSVSLPPEIWAPLSANILKQSHRGNHIYMALARLKPGVSLEQAQAEMKVIASNLDKRFEECRGLESAVVPLKESLSGHLRPKLLPLWAAVGLVLLIACANVANLLLAHAANREKELAVRSALGAGRMRIVRQLLTESVLLAVGGGLVGLLVADAGCQLINGFLKKTSLDLPAASIDSQVLLFTFLLSVLTGVVFGMVPAIESSRPNLNQALKEGGRSASSGLMHRHLKNVLVISEVALSLILLAGAGLLIMSFVRLWQTNPGFFQENVLTMNVPLSRTHFPDRAQRFELSRRLLEQVSNLPGVQSAAFSSHLPAHGGWQWRFDLLDRPAPGPGKEPAEIVQFVSPQYFKTLGIPLRRGRLFSDQDTEKAQAVVVINDCMARKYWGGQDPLGKQIHNYRTDYTIVGIVGDVRQNGLGLEPPPQIYFCTTQGPMGETNLIVRTSVEPLSLAATIRREVLALDKTLPISEVQTLQMVLLRNVASQSLIMSLMGLFAAMALVLALTGIYGVVAYSVAQRRREIGIRIALGATAPKVLVMVLSQGMVLTLAGVAFGGLGALALTRLISSQLYGVSPKDPLIFAGVLMLLVLASLMACFLPARRASKVDPLEALRYE